jgi:hypothetical protein
VTRGLALAGALLVFALLVTANSSGYRYGVSDQAFYAPAVELAAHPTLFPRDRDVLATQTKLWLGDEVLGWLVTTTGVDVPTLFFLFYLVTVAAFAAGAFALARALGADWWTSAAFLTLLTLRHRIARTGANTFEGYMHPRVLAFAVGLAALAFVLRRRWLAGTVLIVVAGVVHPTTAVWFAAAAATMAVVSSVHRTRIVIGLAAVAAIAVLVGHRLIAGRLVVMDPAWLAVFADRDYLFAAQWPLYAWITNLLYPVVIIVIARCRRRAAVTVPGEGALVAAMIVLTALFLASVPFTEARLALAVQMQVNRVFWLLDAVATFYLAWWIVGHLAARWPARARTMLVGGLVALAAARGAYVMHGRGALVQVRPPATDWTAALDWLRGQPDTWQVLAAPDHVWRYGANVRIVARKDVLLEVTKDPAIAMYDRRIAMRVGERMAATANFDAFTIDDVRRLAVRFALDVFIEPVDRPFALPVLYRNASFVVYDLRPR